jgi:predicted nucleic acid-binding protein
MRLEPDDYSMSRMILLDAGPLGMVTHPRKNPEIKAWLDAWLRSERSIVIPEISDYEVRRELLRSNRVQGINRLDMLQAITGYAPITTQVMRKAAQLWATARNQGQPTASDSSLDADVILAATALTLSSDVVIATSNVKHIGRFVSAKQWQEISP